MAAPRDPVDSGQPRVSDEMKKLIGRRIRERRLALGLSQSELGRRMTNSAGNSFAVTQISEWERGIRLPSRVVWGQLAEALETSVGGLFAPLLGTLSVGHDDDLEMLKAEMEALIRILNMRAAVDSAVRADKAKGRRLATPQPEDGPQELDPRKTMQMGRRKGRRGGRAASS